MLRHKSKSIQKGLSMLGMLTNNAISKMKSIETGMNEELIVELSRPKKSKNRLGLMIYDGDSMFKGFLQLKQKAKNVQQLMKKGGKLRIKIIEHITHFQQNNPTQIQIVDFQLITQKKLQISKQIKQYSQSLKTIKKQHRQIQIISLQQASSSSQKHPLQAHIQQNLKTNKKKLKIQSNSDSQQTDVPRANSQINEGYQRIMDLYQDCQDWTVLVRVIDATYREFISNSGKQIKLMAVEMIDRWGSTIIGNLFGNGAKEKHASLNIGSVYRISKGKVKLDTYKKSHKDSQSKFSILFTYNSQFLQVGDNSDIPYFPNHWLRLNQIPHDFSQHESFSFLAIIFEVQQARSLKKDEGEGKSMLLQHFFVGDPVTGVNVRATLWQNKLQLNPSNFVGKSVVLRNFKLNKFKNDITLCSRSDSSILLHNFFADYEGRCRLSSKNEMNTSGNDAVKTIKELTECLQQTRTDQAIVCTIQAWVKQINFNKKWFYDACPNPQCRKSCPNNSSSRCEHCHYPIQTCDKRFKLQIKLADISGSINLTAFHESASAFLKDTPIEEFFDISNRELTEYSESHYCYEQYRVQLKSVRDMMAQLKHTIIGRPIRVDPSRILQETFQRITRLKCELGRDALNE